MEETSVGVSQFMNQVPGFTGVIKHRYTDFVVREVDTTGSPVYLRSLADTSACVPAPAAAPPAVESDGTAEATLGRLLGDDALRTLEKLAGDSDEGPAVLQAVQDKESRSLIHKAIRTQFPALESETRPEDKAIIVSSRAGSTGRGPAKKRQRRDPWPGGALHYVRFTLGKVNRDTHDVLQLIARAIGAKTSAFSTAGVKDRRGVTFQHASAHFVSPEKLADVERKGTLGDQIHIGDFRFEREAMYPGRLQGNHFTIVLREVPLEELGLVDEAVAALREHGFINYYGLQRFGTNSAAPTHLIGRSLLRGEFKQAVELIMRPKAGERTDISDARRLYLEGGDATAAYNALPPFMHLERNLMGALAAPGCERDYAGAIGRLQRGIRTMYLHAYQSFIWNHAASERLAPGRPRVPIPGDLVLTSSGAGGDLEEDGAAVPETRVLTEAEAKDGMFALADVVLPLPGTRVTYPTNFVGSCYSRMMSADGLDPTNMAKPGREHTLAGRYRHLVQGVVSGSCAYRIIHYAADDPDAQLSFSEMDHFRGGHVPSRTPAPEPTGASADHAAMRHAVEIKFTLGAGCYATMALRELCKRPTDVAVQRALVQSAAAGPAPQGRVLGASDGQCPDAGLAVHAAVPLAAAPR